MSAELVTAPVPVFEVIVLAVQTRPVNPEQAAAVREASALDYPPWD